ncbi:MAG: DNA polymerase III subunit alpha [Pseudomonadota bacterium]
MTPWFSHLSLHTEYSLVDSTLRIKPLVQQAAAMEMPALAMTDQHNLFGLVKFVRAAEGAGIKPLAGADLWLLDEEADSPARCTVLCQNQTGYRNLSALLSRSFATRQSHALPCVDPEWLLTHNDGLIVLTGQQQGPVGRLLADGKPNRASDTLARWAAALPDRLYVAISRVGRPGEEEYLEQALKLAHAHQCPVVAVNDVRFLTMQDYAAHEARVCINQGRLLDDPGRPRDYSDQQYLRSAREMAELFHDLPEALENTAELAQRCNLHLELGQYFLPAFPLPDGQTEASYLEQQSLQGLEERLQSRPPTSIARADYDARLSHELSVIGQMGFPGYFLIVADFISWARQQSIPVGPGRGSGAGSLVAYALGITDLDPLDHDLLFERFLNPERVSMPDFDIDFCMDRRDEVIAYVAERYGREKVSQIITFGTMAAKAVVRDAGRVLGLRYGFVDEVAKLVPNTLGITLEGALKESAELAERVDTDDDVAQLMETARSLEGLTRNAGKHAGGVVIAPRPLEYYTPLYSETAGESVVSQFDKDDVEAIGLVKFDFLGLRTLTIIDWAVSAINHRPDQPALDVDSLPMDDAAAFNLLKACQTTAVFQLESRGMKELIRRLQPGSFDDIVALVALYRPGPLDSGMVDTYVDCKHGRQEVRYPHDELEPILEPTYGVILYQEQVMQIAQVMAGYTLGGADILRRAMGKKKPAEMAKQRSIFVDGATARGIDGALAESVFDLMEKFAGYGFNKSHSAAYALLSYQTAFLKAHYPGEFMAAVLSADMDNTDKVVVLIDDTKQMGLELLAPDVNQSAYAFKALDDHQVLYGLGAIKGLGRSAIDACIEERDQHGPFTDLLQLCNRVDMSRLNKRGLEALIMAGALDCLGQNRATLFASLPEVMKAAEQSARDRAAGQSDLFGAPAPVAKADPTLTVLADFDDDRRLRGERDTLGLYLSGHPLDPYRSSLENVVNCPLGGIDKRFGKLNSDNRRGVPATLAGLIMGLRKRGERNAFAQLDDGTGRIELAFFGKAMGENVELLNNDQLVVAEGNLLPDDVSGSVKMRVERLKTIDDTLASYARALRLTLNRTQLDLAALRETLLPHQPGNTPVVLSYHNDTAEAHIQLGDAFNVKPTRSLLEGLTGVPGVAGARLLFSELLETDNAYN